MKVIFAESGQGTIIDNESCPTLSTLKDYLYTTTNIPIDQQILLTSSGIQLKDVNYSPTHSTELFILFNRQHLERSTTTDDNNTTLNNDRQEQQPWFKSMVDSRIPSTIDSNQLDQLRTSFTALVKEYKDGRSQAHGQQWSPSNYTEFYQRFIRTIRQTVQEIANLASKHGIMADTMTQELRMQAIALNAALSNLDNHIKTTYDHQNKFDRIAKRELGKHTRWIQLVDKDLSFMQDLKLHPQIQTQINNAHHRPDSSSSCLIDCFSLTPLDSAKAQLQKNYDRLHRKTNSVHERMDTIYQLSTNINVQRTGSEAVVNKVARILGEIQTYLSLIDDIWLHFEQRWKQRDMDSSFGATNGGGGDQMMEGIIDGGDGDSKDEMMNDTTTDLGKQQMDISDSDKLDIEVGGSEEQSNDNNNNNNNNNNNLDATMKKTELRDLSDEALTHRLFLYESIIRHALETIMKEKCNAMGNFFQCLQTISTLEESIANLFLSLRHLGTDIKQLGQRTGQLETVSKGIIEGYGLMLIELWRRNQYNQIISKNTELLNGLFTTFASSEQQYRDNFQTDICMIDGLDSLFSDSTKIKEEMCIIPFIWPEFTNDDRHCTAIPALDITLLSNHKHQPSDNNNTSSSTSSNNKTIPFESTPLICKKDVDEFIDLMQSYYTTFEGNQGQTNDKAAKKTMVQRLSEKFDRESRRLTHGLVKLGLPNSKAEKESLDAQFSSSSSASSPSNTSNISTIIPTLSSTTSTTMQVQPSSAYNLPFVPSLSKKEWGSSSIYAQVQQQQDLKSKIDALEKELKRDHQIFEKQRSVLLEEIKMKDNQIQEKEQQWESRWSAKLQEIQHQLELEQKAHENDILEWKQKYQEAMDTEQQKHYRRLAYFHERLAAKNAEYAELELQLTHSAPSSPVQATHATSLADSSLNGGVTVSSLLDADYTNMATKEQGQGPYRWRRSASLDATTTTPDSFSKRMKTPVAQAGRLKLATVAARRQPIVKTSRPGGDSSSLVTTTMTTTTAAESFKDDLYARELQDLTLRHQASVDNMVSEYEENRIELLAQHDREKEVWKIEHDAKLQDACQKLAQEHQSILNSIHEAWQQKWDDLAAQNKRDQVMQQQQWDQQLAAEKRLWEEKQLKEQAALNKQLSWSKGELHMVLKEHETAIRLAKQLNLVIDHTTDVDDMKYTLLGLLETGIQNASRLDSQHYLTEKSSETTSPFGFMNMSFF